MDTARPLVDRYNEKLAAAERERLETNRVVLAELKQGTITCEEADRRMVRPFQQARVKVNGMRAHRFRKQWGWVENAVNTAGKFLDYDDPQMIKHRHDDRRPFVCYVYIPMANHFERNSCCTQFLFLAIHR